MSNVVKYFHSGMAGAPVLSGTAGALIGVLDACLVNGFGLKTVDSLVVSGGIATMNIASGHSFEPDTVALVAGATPAGLNGEKRILSVTASAATFDATGISNQTATGTISTRLAPLTFAKAFSGTNLAVYRSADVTGTREFLRVNDTGTINARVLGYESMTDVNNGIGPFPTEGQVAGGRWWPKAAAAGATARAWTLVGDGKTFYLNAYSGNLTTGDFSGFLSSFGDFSSERLGDPYACVLTGLTTDLAGSQTTTSLDAGQSSTGSSPMGNVPRNATFLGSSIEAYFRAESFFVGSALSGSVNSGTGGFPSSVNNGMYISSVLLIESSPLAIRGRVRGLFHVPQSILGSFLQRQKIDGRGSLLGKRLMAVKCGSPAGGPGAGGIVFFDITGPWL